jgi:hypothetical protein
LQAAAAGGVEARDEAAAGDVAGGGVDAVTVVVFVSVLGAGVTGRPAGDALVDMGVVAPVLEAAVVPELHALITTTAAVRVVETTIRELMKVITKLLRRQTHRSGTSACY